MPLMVEMLFEGGVKWRSSKKKKTFHVLKKEMEKEVEKKKKWYKLIRLTQIE